MELIVLLIYGVPLLLGILLIRYIVLKARTKKAANITAITLFVLGAIALTVIFVSDRLSRSHHAEIAICESITLELDALEMNTFLDWQVEFTGKIVNHKLNNVHTFQFTLGNGPYIELFKDSTSITISTYSPTKSKIVSFPFVMNDCLHSEKYTLNSAFEFRKE